MNWPILSTLIIIPLIGCITILLINSTDDIGKRNIKLVSLYASIVNFLISIILWVNFDKLSPDFQFVERYAWLSENITYYIGVDGISIFLIILTTFLMPFCILISWNSVKDKIKEYMIAFLVLETLMIGVFSALDLVVFYLFFEACLIPMFLIIGIWGGVRRVYATFKFFLYTLSGSVLMLIAIIYIYIVTGTTDIVKLDTYLFDYSIQTWLWLAFFISFAVKIPMFPVHTWLPDAHVEAPTAGSVILAGVLLKMGGYGLLRFSIPLFPVASYVFMDFVFVLSVIAIIYTSFIAIAQEDIKKLIAYSSVAHMGFVTMGIFTFTEQGIQGAIFQMLSHGLISSALFLSVGVVYDRMHTREISVYGGVVRKMPIYASFFLVFTMANIGLPGTSGFVGEFLTLIGAFKVDIYVALFATTGVILSAVYALWLYKRVFLGQIINDKLNVLEDISSRELFILAPFVLLIILFGFYPNMIIELTAESSTNLINNYNYSLEQYQSFLTLQDVK
ncbi:MAG: NADH-quinone oxidoreductase subunit M [Rhodobiaceae bacterium]|mgnify:FL=1|uniref:NADH-quinone oxidoreductase subunit M n=1 Tax=PS1 clade bacterium TaxID=2175152 RepID=A0A368DK87_9PROT|nr:NADH-quinone oxidoreductase subunit M [Rhodobiaceae bacterium]OUT73805.1 MAG: NADH-quinone oxidoreductase subunit M [Rhizobiales bacterium TMED25]RCL72258.1 MAG: NADH-quinone oxidoreductase subunit M [PS1 clade bacterium]|tara:strand:+ start:6141 stop:7655 length:1515 start_codon:yes stop_codon:yes gene_type:complete